MSQYKLDKDCHNSKMDGHISRSNILYGSADDVWPDVEKLYRDQMFETCQKLPQLDDEIWGKIILMERNKRVAKAYIRAQIVTVDGSSSPFDGYRLGFSAFENPFRDKQIFDAQNKIGLGVRLKMDQQGNILAKREGTCSMTAHGISHPEQHCLSQELQKSGGHLPHDKPVKVFDMNVFKKALKQELQQPYPERKKLLFKSVVAISFVRASSNPLNTPCWFLLINLVAVDMLNSQVPPLPGNAMLGRRTSEGMLPELKSGLMQGNNQVTPADVYASAASLGGAGWTHTMTPQGQRPYVPTYAAPPWYELQQQSMMNSQEQLVQLANALALGFQPQQRSAMMENQAAAAALLWQQQKQRNQQQTPTSGAGYVSECEVNNHNRGIRPRSETGFRPLNRGWPPAQSTESLYGPHRDIPSSASNFTLRPKAPLSGATALQQTKKLFNAVQYRNFKPSNWSSGSVSDYECSQTYDSSPYSSNTSAASGRPSSPSIVSEESPSDSGYTEGSSRSIRVRTVDVQAKPPPPPPPVKGRRQEQLLTVAQVHSNSSSSSPGISSLSSSPSSTSSSSSSSPSKELDQKRPTNGNTSDQQQLNSSKTPAPQERPTVALKTTVVNLLPGRAAAASKWKPKLNTFKEQKQQPNLTAGADPDDAVVVRF